MAAQPPRRFEILDMFILIAAMAVGAMSIRPWLLYGRGILDFFTEFYPSVRGTGYPSVVVQFVEPWLASLTVAMVMIRLRRCRLRFSRLVRQPGLAACVAATVMIGFSAILASVTMAILSVPLNQEIFYLKFLMPIFEHAGAAVASVWLIMVLARAWRSEAGWVDRTGRLLGVCWIVVYLVLTWDSFWFSGVSFRAMPPMPTPAEMATQDSQTAEAEATRERELSKVRTNIESLKQRNSELQRNIELQEHLLKLDQQKLDQKPTSIRP